MKILFLLFLLFSSIFAIEYDNRIEGQCKYIVNGAGDNDDFTHVYMAGLVSKRVYTTDFKYLTKLAKISTRQYTIKVACQEALLNTNNLKFAIKFRNGLSVTVDSRYAKHSRLK